MNVTVYKIVRTLVEEVIDDADLVSINDAALSSGLTISGISRLLDKGRLPKYRLLPRLDEASKRYTSRKALVALSKDARVGARAKKATK